MTASLSLLNLPQITTSLRLHTASSNSTFLFKPHLLQISKQVSIRNSGNFPRFSRSINIKAVTAMAAESAEPSSKELMNLLFVEMGVGYDQHGFVSFCRIFKSSKYFFLGNF